VRAATREIGRCMNDDDERDAWIERCSAELRAFRPGLTPDEAEQLAADIWCDGPSMAPEDAAEREVASWRSLGLKD
jgi:hypothetical protein